MSQKELRVSKDIYDALVKSLVRHAPGDRVRAADVLSMVRSMVLKPDPITPQRIGALQMRNMFGATHSNILYYDCDGHKFNRDVYLGYDVPDGLAVGALATEFKQILASQPLYQGRELVAVAVMPAERWNTAKGVPVDLSDVQFDSMSKAIVGTIVSRDTATGKIVAPQIWMGGNRYLWRSKIAQQGVSDFIGTLVANRKTMWELLRRVHTK